MNDHKLEQTYLIVTQSSFESFRYDKARISLSEAALADREQLDCIARVFITVKSGGPGWEFIAKGSLPLPGSEDLRDSSDNKQEILYVSSDIERTNVARVTDIKNAALDGLGVSTWLIEQARLAFLTVSGPDPWISGWLTPIDADNPRRIPFWQRHVDQLIEVDDIGNGSVCAPWIRGYNPYLSKTTAIKIDQRGQMPRRTTQTDLMLYEHHGRTACRFKSRLES